jgi:hypothetical protein
MTKREELDLWGLFLAAMWTEAQRLLSSDID